MLFLSAPDGSKKKSYPTLHKAGINSTISKKNQLNQMSQINTGMHTESNLQQGWNECN